MMPRFRDHGTKFCSLMLGIVVIGSACSSEPTDISSNSDPASRFTADPLNPDGAIHSLGRGLAIALNDPSVRAWVRSEIDKSPYVEWRVAFKQNVIRQAESPQLKRVFTESRLGAAGSKAITAGPELELYMPIPIHRTAWKGDALIQVAVPVKRDEAYTLYSLDGAAKRVGNHIPAIPTLVLGPSEIDYGDLESAVRGGNRTGDMMGASQSLRPSFSFGISTAQHTRLTYIRTVYDHDGGLAGGDEVEVFGAMTDWFAGNGTHEECARYTDVHKNNDYYLPNAPVMTVATAVPTGSPDKVYLHAYEDDTFGCIFVRGDDDFYGKISLSIGQYGTIWGTIRDSGAPGHISLRVHAGTP